MKKQLVSILKQVWGGAISSLALRLFSLTSLATALLAFAEYNRVRAPLYPLPKIQRLGSATLGFRSDRTPESAPLLPSSAGDVLASSKTTVWKGLTASMLAVSRHTA